MITILLNGSIQIWTHFTFNKQHFSGMFNSLVYITHDMTMINIYTNGNYFIHYNHHLSPWGKLYESMQIIGFSFHPHFILCPKSLFTPLTGFFIVSPQVIILWFSFHNVWFRGFFNILEVRMRFIVAIQTSTQDKPLFICVYVSVAVICLMELSLR